MINHMTEDELLAALPTLTRSRLVGLVESELVIPLCCVTEDTSSHVFRSVDFARVQLLCELTDHFDLDENALGVVISLIDQLHTARQDLLALARAVEAEAPDVRSRIGTAILERQK